MVRRTNAPTSGAKTVLNFRSFTKTLATVTPNLGSLLLAFPNDQPGSFRGNNAENTTSYSWPIYFTPDFLNLPKLKTLTLEGFAFVEGSSPSISVPNLESFSYEVKYPNKTVASMSSGYMANLTEAKHTNQIAEDLRVLNDLKASLVEGCPNLNHSDVNVEVKYRNDNLIKSPEPIVRFSFFLGEHFG